MYCQDLLLVGNKMLVSYKMLTCEILAKDLTKVAFLGLFVEVQVPVLITEPLQPHKGVMPMTCSLPVSFK